MRYLQDDSFPGCAEADDDVDRLFKRLKPVEPPADLLVRLLNSIAHVSPRPSDPALSWDHECHGDGLVVRNEKQEPS